MLNLQVRQEEIFLMQRYGAEYQLKPPAARMDLAAATGPNNITPTVPAIPVAIPVTIGSYLNTV